MIIRPTLPEGKRIHARHRGLSLVELLISMVIGLVVIGVVFANYLTSGTGKNSNTALSQISEDATTALNFLRKQITQAGYSRAYALNGTNGIERFYNGQALFGCDGDFANPKAPVIDELTCKTGSTGPSSIAIAYEADSRNSVLRTPSGGGAARPGDCTGNAIAEALKGTEKYYVAEARLFLSDANEGALSCQGNGQTTLPIAGGSQLDNASSPLINNVHSMRIRYGVAPSSASGALPLTPVKFALASEVSAAKAWNDVVAVRICIVVRSEEEVMPDKTPYYDCEAVESTDPKPSTPADRRLYRAFSSTVMVQNRLGR